MTSDKWKLNMMTVIWSCCCLVFLIPVAAAVEDVHVQNLTFHPTELKKMPDGTQHVFSWSTNMTGVVSVTATVQDERVLEIFAVGDVIENKENGTFYGHVNVSALFIGYSNITVKLYDAEGSILAEETLSTSVILSYQYLSNLFTQVIRVFIAITYVFMGAAMDFSIIKQILKRPTGPAIGMVCQYVLMPMISFSLGKLAFPGNPMAQLGMFLSGCSPGGGVSNMWTHLLGGSLDLSIMMTFISNIFAFGTIPLWIYLMGPLIVDDNTNFVLPFKEIGFTLVILAVPCVAGMALKFFFPRVGPFLERLIAPMSTFNIVFTFTFGVYSNRYIFSFFTFRTLLIGFSVPFLGYLSGLLLAKILCQTVKDIIAIGIETGVQNNAVAYIILKLSFENPAGDIAAVFPCAVIIMGPIPLLGAFVIKKIYECFAKSKSHDITHFKTEKSITNGDITKSEEKPHKQALDADKKIGVDNPAAELSDDAV